MLYEISIPPFIKMLQNLKTILDKGAQFADGKKIEMDVLLNARLAPDQFNLMRQVQIACDTAKLCAARVGGKEAPKNEDGEKTLAELKARIDSTISFLKTFSTKDFVDSESKRITTPRWEGKSLSGTEYVLQHAIPNAYFHTTTAYAILRHNGVEVGKKDYLGELPFQK
jgi:hypothetical protein